ncbi:hypothetical protein QUB19_19395 [Microcoleus sp. B4-C5]
MTPRQHGDRTAGTIGRLARSDGWHWQAGKIQLSRALWGVLG